MIHCIHQLKGRARFRVEGLRGSRELASFLRERLPAHPAVISATASALTGNVLVSFGSEQSREATAAALEAVADVGVSLGLTGSDLAREAADIILEDDDLNNIISVVRNGRNSYDNIKQSVRFLLTTNISEIITRVAATAAGCQRPVSELHSVCLNLLYLTLSLDPPPPGVMQGAPRRPDEPLIGAAEKASMTRDCLAVAAGAVGVGGYGLIRYGFSSKVGAMAFHSLGLGQILYASTCRAHSVQPGDAHLPTNPYFSATLFGSLALQLGCMFIPGIRSVVGLTFLRLRDVAAIGAGAVLPVLLTRGRSRRRLSLKP